MQATQTRETKTPLEHALDYAAKGMPVFPCIPTSKRPYTQNGFKDASTGEAQIGAWWEQWPDAMIGMPTGAKSGLVVVDCDTHKPEGRDSYERVMGLLPETRQATSASGGKHFYYRYPGQHVKNVAPIPGHPGIDMRGDGGYIILPGSVTADGRVYRWVDEATEIAELPTWVLDALSSKPTRGTITTGGRNTALTSVAGSLVAAGIRGEPLRDALVARDLTVNTPPLGEREVTAIYESAERNFDGALPKTDADNGQWLAACYAGHMVYVPVWGWLFYDGKRWQQDEGGNVKARELAERAMRALITHAATLDRREDMDALIKHARSSLSLQRLNAAIELSKGRLLARVEDFDKDPYLLNCDNGTLDLRTMELRPHNPADMLTKLAPVAYDVAAKSEVLVRFLEGITCGDIELAAFLQRAIGYSLSGTTKDDKIFLCHGSGANGKSTFLETMLAILGDYGLGLTKDFVREDTPQSFKLQETARLPGKRFGLVPEVKGEALDTELLKGLSGGDTMTGRLLYHEPFNFVPQVKLWVTANQRPKVTEVTEAIWRRLLLVPFLASFRDSDASTDHDMGAKLMGDAPALLAWAVEGFKHWNVEGLQPPSSVREATEDYRRAEDPDLEFFEERTEPGPSHKTERGDLLTEYRAWANSIGDVTRSYATPNDFYAMVEAHGYRQKKSGKRYFLGLQLRNTVTVTEEVMQPKELAAAAAFPF